MLFVILAPFIAIISTILAGTNSSDNFEFCMNITIVVSLIILISLIISVIFFKIKEYLGSILYSLSFFFGACTITFTVLEFMR